MSTANQIAAERMYLNADKTAVLAEGHKDCAFLYAGEGDEIPASACERFGITDGKVPAKGRVKSADAKSKDAPPNKDKAPPANKGGKKPADKSKAPELTDIAGVGPATASALVTAGVKDVAALAAVDPENPPTLETAPPNFSWVDVVAAAKQAVEGAAK